MKKYLCSILIFSLLICNTMPYCNSLDSSIDELKSSSEVTETIEEDKVESIEETKNKEEVENTETTETEKHISTLSDIEDEDIEEKSEIIEEPENDKEEQLTSESKNEESTSEIEIASESETEKPLLLSSIEPEEKLFGSTEPVDYYFNADFYQGISLTDSDNVTITFKQFPEEPPTSYEEQTDLTLSNGLKRYLIRNGSNVEIIIYAPTEGTIYAPENCQNLFSYDQLIRINSLKLLNTSNVNDMTGMFSRCSLLQEIDTSNFDTSNVIYMSNMFKNCSNLTSLDLSNFDTSNVRSMFSMFYNCNGLTSIDVSSFDTSNYHMLLTNMFKGCSSLISLDLSSFDVDNSRTSMSSMFANCSNLKTVYVSNNFKVNNFVSQMFQNCTSLTGGKGTTYDPEHDWDYARIDGGPISETPGYFTLAGSSAPTLSSITADTSHTKLDYNEGDTFDPTGLVITLTYSDDSTETITYNDTTKADFTFSPTESLTKTDNVITITYGGKLQL